MSVDPITQPSPEPASAGRASPDHAIARRALISAQEISARRTLTSALELRLALTAQVERSSRGGPELSCAFIDLDSFELIHDRSGQSSAETLLAAVADELRDAVREGDLLGRYGGDEFVLILPEAGESGALAVARRVRSRIRGITSAIGDPIDASIGVAQWTLGASAEELLRRADRALLSAKLADSGIAAASGHAAIRIRAGERAGGPPHRARWPQCAMIGPWETPTSTLTPCRRRP